MTKHTLLASALAVAALSATPAGAQVFAPTFLSPVPTSDVGVYVYDWDGGNLGIEGVWRRGTRGGSDLGLHAGYVDAGDGFLTIGLDVRNPVVLAGAPIGLAFTAAGQAVVGSDAYIGAQAGFTAGQPFQAGNVTLTPYIHPRLAVANGIIIGADDDDSFDVDVLADVGVDLHFASGIALKFGANLGDGADWGLGVSWRQ